MEGIRWISVAVNLSRDPETRDVCLYAYLKQTGPAERVGEAAGETGQDRSGYGGVLYSRYPERELLEKFLEQRNSHTCILALIRIEGGG